MKTSSIVSFKILEMQCLLESKKILEYGIIYFMYINWKSVIVIVLIIYIFVCRDLETQMQALNRRNNQLQELINIQKASMEVYCQISNSFV